MFPAALRRWLPFALVTRFLGFFCVFSFICASCSSPSFSSHSTVTPSPTQAIPMLNALVSPHVLTVGSFTNYMPQEYVDPKTGHIVGFDIDLANALASRLHLHTQVISTNFSLLTPELLADRYDVVISAVAITPELQKQVNFIPYFRGGESLMVMKGNPYAIQRLRDLCGRSVAAIRNTFEQQELQEMSNNCLKAHKRPVTSHIVPLTSDALQLLRSGTVSAIYQDSTLTDYFVKIYSQDFALGGPIIESAIEGIAVRKEDTATFNALQSALKTLQADGTYHSLIEKWGLSNGDITASSASRP